MDTASLATNNTALGTAQNSVATHFVARHAFGCHAPKSDGVQAFGASSGGKDLIDRLVYKVGKQVCVFDPDGGKQSFFENRLPNVTDILHFCVSPNSKYLSVCEVTRLEKTGEVSSQVSVYSLTTMKRMRTMPHAASKPFVCSTFCGDPKLLAALSDDPDRHIFVWQWEKEKLFKSTAVTMNANLIRSAPSTVLMLTTSGQSVMKFWHLSSDGFMKHGSFLPVSKENNEKFLDHMWLQSNLGQHRMVALVDPDHSASEGHGQKSRKQLVHIFEGVDVVAPNGSTLASSGLAPIAMELKQTLSLRLELNCKIEKIVLYSKSFMLAGSMGLICQYERSDDKHEPYIESRRISLGDLHIKMATVYPSEEKIVLLTKAGRMLTMPLDVSMDNLANAAKGSLDELDSNSIGSVDDANSSNSQERRRGNTLHGIADLTSGGYHHTAILSADLSHERPIMFTVAADSTARIWNYQTQKCELVHYFRNDEPISCAIHSAGFQALVSFKDRVRLYNVLMDKLKPYKETIMKNCKCLKFSHGSQYWAAASAITVSVYDTKTFTQLMSFQGHMMTVVKLSWAAGDQILFSAGMDGNVYGWPIFKEGRIDVIAANNRSSAVLDLIVDSPSTIFTNTKQTNNDSGDVDHNEFGEFGNPVSPTNANSSVLKKKEKAGNSSELTTLQILEKRYALIISSLDGSLKLPSWSFESVKASSVGKSVSSDNMQIINGDPSVAITALALNSDRTKLYAGTSVGSLRVYQWPPSDEKHNRRRSSHHYTQHTTSSAVAASAVSVTDTSKYDSSQFYELFSHSTAVISITLSPQENILMSAAADGSVFIHNIVNETAKEEIKVDDPFELNSDAIVLNSEVVLMSLEDIEDHVNEVVELQKTLNETKAKNEFNSRKLESEHNDTIKKMTEVHDATITKEKDNFEKQRIAFDRRIRELMAAIEAKETDHIKVITELENKYEHKLADQLERYDMLSEKMQLLKQKCEGLLEAEKNNFHKQLNDVKDEARTREKKLKIENRRALEDKSANEAAFKEIVNQQEEEYEDELKQLIGAAESELVSERETILKLRTLVQTKNTKLDQLKKKLVELSTSSKARLTLLNHERAEKQKLYDTIEHYKKNLIERENALAEKEKMVLELRSTTRTLENFRFVLDHRLQQLSSERGPITNHIEGLEKHISTMYEELVDEFTNKKATQEASHLKDQKISWISRDLIKTKQLVREKEHVIEAFKRELGNVISSMVIGKELEEAIKLLYKKFVRGETVGQAFVRISDAAVEVADELLIDDDERTILSLDAPGM